MDGKHTVSSNPPEEDVVMDTSFSEQDLAFRDEVRQFFAEAYDEDLKARLAHPDTYKSAMIDWQRRPDEPLERWLA